MGDAHWVDSHGHLFLLEQEPEVALQRAIDAGVEWLVCPGIDVETSEQARDLAERFPDRVQWTAGLHPHDAEQWPSVAARIGELAAEADGVGECGLDYYRNLSPRDAQIEAFKDQLGLAKTHDIPIVIHCRDAFSDVFDLVGEADLGEKAVLHCWTGGRKWTKRFRELGVTFSFAGALTYATADALRLAAREVPRDRTMVETDSPYLTPEPKRSEANEPANVPITGAVLAEVWDMPVEEVAAATSSTAARVFGSPRA